MGINSAVYLVNFYFFTLQFDFMKRLLKSNTCLAMFHSLSLVRKFVDDLFVPNYLNFENFMYLHPDSFGSGINPKASCKLNYTSEGFFCNFLDLTVSQSP
jgi:hypothetical protein